MSTALLADPRRGPRGRLLAVLVVLVVVPGLGLWWVGTGGPWMGSDLDAYRAGSRHLGDGLLYGVRHGLPFTYPPFAAAALWPFERVREPVAQAVWLLVTWAAYVGFVTVLWHRLVGGRHVPLRLLLVGLAFEPVWHTVALGQVNLVLALVVAVDVFVLPRRWRGLGVGVAAGFKLTPAIFVLYFLVRREWDAALRAGVGLALTIGVGAVVDPGDSRLFWTRLFYSPGHVPRVEYVNNQSVFGVLTRAFHTEHPPTLVYAALCVPVLALTAYAALRQTRAGADVAALTCVAVGGLLVSPVSWSHHWVWLLPAAAVLVVGRHRLVGGLVVLAAVVAPMRFVGTGAELHQDVGQQAVCATYVAVGLLFLVVMFFAESAPIGADSAKNRVGLTGLTGVRPRRPPA